MICITNDTPLRRVGKLTNLIDKIFEKIYKEVENPETFAALEEEYLDIKKGV